MTNFEKLKEGLDVLFEDIDTEDELIEFLSEHLDCNQCKIFDECSKIWDSDRINTSEYGCHQILRLYLRSNCADRNWAEKIPG